MKFKNTFLILLILLMGIPLVHAIPSLESKEIKLPPQIEKKTEKESIELKWYDNIDTAMAKASMEYRPIMIEFMSPTCPWCSKLEDLFNTKEIAPLLKELILVRININEDAQSAQYFHITSVPVISFCSAGGRELIRLNGYVNKATLLQAIQAVLNNKIVAKNSSQLSLLMRQLKNNKVKDEAWADIMLAIGQYPNVRSNILKLIRNISPFPKQLFVKMLEDKRLGVRLGALEILEEFSGSDFDFEPWTPPDSDKNIKSLKNWQKWADAAPKGKEERFSSLTAEGCAKLLQQAICGDRNREYRAVRLLRRAGPKCVDAIEKFLKDNPGISKGKRNKIKELEYSLLIPSSIGKDPIMLAHKLIYGKLDSRMQAIIELKKSGRSVTPILQDLLRDKDAMIRETAIETLIVTAGYKCLPILSEHLLKEKDNDVIYSVLRGISEIKNRNAGKIFLKYLNDPNENLVIASLNGIASSKNTIKKDQLLKILKDKRWRVRVAGLDLISKLKLKSVTPQVEKILADDPDEYVKYKAVETYSKVARKNAIKTLEKAFIKDDSLKGAIIAAFGSLDKNIPKSFIVALEGKSEQVLMSVVQGMDACGKEALPLALYLAENKITDVKIAAVRFLSKHGISKKRSKYNAMLLKKLKTGDNEEKLAILHSFSPPMSQKRYSYNNTNELDELLFEIEEDATDKKDKSSDELVGLFEAFEDKPADAKKEQKPQKQEATGAKDILDLFESFEKEEKPVKAPTASKEKETQKNTIIKVSDTKTSSSKSSLKDLQNEIKKIFTNTKNDEIKFYTASILTMFGDQTPLPYLKKNFSKQTLEMRSGILDLLQRSKKKEVIDFAFSALNDPDDSIRTEASSIILDFKKGKPLTKLLNTLEVSGTPLKAYDFYYYDIRDAYGKPGPKKAARKWANKILKSSKNDPVLATFAIYLLDKTWMKGDEKIVDKYIKSKNKWIRRAAYHALGNDRSSKGQFEKIINKLIQDPDPKVRVVLAKVIQRRAKQSYENSWVHFYNDKHFFEDHYWGESSNFSRKISEKIEKALIQLTKDEDPKVQMEASFALLSCRKPINLGHFIAVLQTFPDQHAIGNRVKSFLQSNYRSLGDSFSALLGFINKDDLNDSNIKKIFKHFNVAGEKIRDFKFSLKKGDQKEIKAAFLELDEDIVEEASPTENMRLVYFRKIGCQDCIRVEKELRKLKEIFPNLTIETHNITKVKSMRLNETYCERFGVPEKLRLVAPSIFGGKGFLIKNDVLMSKLIPLAAETANIPLKQWYFVDQEDFQVSEKRIKERYKKTSVLMIILAGLLDGINPCAFATIIFFLSYLQITRKSSKEILMVGISFIMAVFLSYMAFGFGLSEIIGRLYIFEFFRLWFNRLMALAVFIIMVMSTYDGILCLKGKMEGMALQLPDFLKEKIRKTIRTGAKSSKFVIAAFLVGCIVSFLELACTGQVYAPMIAYMWQTGNDYSGTAFYIIIYNLMFIIPLIIIFMAAYLGLKSDTLTTVFKKHAALVKFSTAILFLLLLISLIYTSHLLG